MKLLLDRHLTALRIYLAVCAMPDHERPRGALYEAKVALEAADAALRESVRRDRGQA